VPPIRSLIFRKHDRGEADEIVKFLARDAGWLTGVAKNAKKSRVRFGGHLEPFSLVDLLIRPRRKDDMVWIDESQVLRGFIGIRADISKVARAAYFMEVAALLVPEGQPEPELFDFVLGFLDVLDTDDPGQIRLLLDEISLLGLLGYGPRFDLCPACGKALAPGQDGFFSVALGGVCHRTCAGQYDRPLLVLSPDTLAVVRRAQGVGRLAANRLRLSQKGLQELRAALSAFVRHIRGEEVGSLLFLENMGF
jgi:DNA repair protein RecO (recombination protein O)